MKVVTHGREQAGSVKVSGMSGLAQSTREAVYHKTNAFIDDAHRGDKSCMIHLERYKK